MNQRGHYLYQAFSQCQQGHWFTRYGNSEISNSSRFEKQTYYKPVVVKRADRQPSIVSPDRFPPSNFTYFWTLFSKSFSSFPHGTCLLSVSTLYLALGELKPPLSYWRSNQKYSNILHADMQTNRSLQRTFTLRGRSFHIIFSRLHTVSKGCLTLQLENSAQTVSIKVVGLILFHSPLLKESRLLSFPPLINMLKFRG